MPPSRTALERNIRLFYVLRLLRYLQVWLPVWVVYLTVEQGFSLTQVTTADGLYFVGVTVLEVPTGAVADRWGRSVSVGLGALSLAVALLFFAFTTSYAILLASFMVWAVAEALYSGADLALLYDTLKALGREHEYERHAGRGEAALAAGSALGVLLGGPVAAVTSTQATILIGAGTTAMTAVLAFAMVEAPVHSAGSGGPAFLPGLKRALSFVRSHAAVRGMLIFGGVMGAGLGAQGYLLQPYLVANDVQIGWLFSVLQMPIQIGFIVGPLLAATLVVRLGEPRLLPGLVGIGGLALLLVWGTTGLAGIALLALVAAVEMAIRPITTGYVNRRVPSEQRETILSMQSFSMSLVIAPLAPLVGATADSGGVRAGYLLLAGVVILGGGAATGLWARAHRASGGKPPTGQGTAPGAGAAAGP